jgi:LuxR family transcriptional regulator, quorum-sensing system regulator BjaR1
MTTQATSSVIEQLSRATAPEIVLEVFEQALSQIGAEYLCVIFLPRPGEHIEDVCLAWKVPPLWRTLYSVEDFFQRDPAVRQTGRTVLPFDWKDSPYDPEAEPEMGEVMDRARDFGVHKGMVIPIPSPGGMIGGIWVAGPHFDERQVHEPFLHTLSLHVFHRLQHLVGGGVKRHAHLSDREREILAWASEGKTAWEIGCILTLSQRTVEWHIGQACKKLGATNRLQAIAILGNTRSMLDPIIEDAPTALR